MTDEYEYIDLGEGEVEVDTKFNIHTQCPKCGEEYNEYDIMLEHTYEVECEKCGHKYSFSYCPW